MPMYEYGCQSCHNVFTKLRRMDQSDADVTCPDCGTATIQRKFSVFASISKNGGGEMAEAVSQPQASSGGCGGCGGGCACGSK